MWIIELGKGFLKVIKNILDCPYVAETAALLSVISAIISIKISNKTKNLDKYKLYSEVWDKARELKESYRTLINYSAEPGINYSDQISKYIEEIIDSLSSKDGKKIEKILNSNLNNYQEFISLFQIELFDSEIKDEKLFIFAKNLDAVKKYLKQKKEKYESKISK